MLCMLIAYDEQGNVVATLDHMVARDEHGNVTGLVDFQKHETAGENLTDVWKVGNAVGSGAWPEWIGGRAHDFIVEVEPEFSMRTPRGERPEHRIKALVHKTSGVRRERTTVEAAIAKRIEEAAGRPADIRDIVGGPGAPLSIDDEGRTRPKVAGKKTTTRLPVIRRGR